MYFSPPSNHLKSMIEDLIDNIGRKISMLSSDYDIFNRHAPYYNEE